MAEDNSVNFNNMFQSSYKLTALNSSFSEGGYVQPEEVKEMAATVSKTIEPILVRLTNEVTSLRQEIRYLRNEVKELKNEKSSVIIIIVMPENPYKVMDDFLKFEKQLQDDKKFSDSFAKELQTVAKAPNFTKNCWRKLLVDEVAQRLCWKGTEEKKSVRSLSTSKAIGNAAISIGLGEDEFV